MTRRPSCRPAERATDREVGVVAAVLVAGSEKAAAHRLGLTHSTVKHHVANARSKVGAATTAQLVWTVAAATRADPEGGDVLAQMRINRERDQAALRFARDRDLGQLEATMARLAASTRTQRRRWSVRHGRRRQPRRAPTSSSCRTCGRRPRTPAGMRSSRRPSKGSTSWG